MRKMYLYGQKQVVPVFESLYGFYCNSYKNIKQGLKLLPMNRARKKSRSKERVVNKHSGGAHSQPRLEVSNSQHSQRRNCHAESVKMSNLPSIQINRSKVDSFSQFPSNRSITPQERGFHDPKGKFTCFFSQSHYICYF